MAILEIVECSDIEGKSTHEIFKYYRDKADRYGADCDWYYLKHISAVVSVEKVATYQEAEKRATEILGSMLGNSFDGTCRAVTCPQGPMYDGKHIDGITTVFFVGVFQQ